MATLEQVEKLRERADVSFAEAQDAIERANGDLLDALILLEREGKVAPPPHGGRAGAGSKPEAEKTREEHRREWERNSARFKEGAARVGRFLLRMIELGNSNYLDAIHRDVTVLSCPVLALIVLLVFFFWIVVPLMVLGLFFGWRYRFRGADLEREDLNHVMDRASEMAEELKDELRQEPTDTAE